MALDITRRQRAAGLLNTASALLAAGVVTDSTAEHYRARFHNPAMFVGPVASAIGLTAALAAVRDPAGGGLARRVVFAISIVTGLAGLGFHAMNVSRRPGGWNSTSILYGAPMAAPLANTMAGLLGIAASRCARQSAGGVDGRAVGILCAVGLVGTSAEAAALHFRGAFQNPLMYGPVILPPVAACELVAALTTRGRQASRIAQVLLRATVLLGVVGTALHGWGIHRRMGGWRNWTQNVLAGPPLPAPPAFTALAFAGLAALELRPADGRR